MPWETVELDTDGWNWVDPRWRERVDELSLLALSVEGVRRAVELRDALAEGKSPGPRALFLNAVMNAIFAIAVEQRASDRGVTIEVPHGTAPEIVEQLQKLGLLAEGEHRAVV